MWRFASVLAMLGILDISTCVAAGSPLKPGDTLNYTMTTSWSEKPPKESIGRKKNVDWAKLPDIVTSTSSTFSVKIERLDADGSAHASIAISNGNKRVPGWSVSAVEVTVMPDGQIVPKVDLGMLQPAGIDPNQNSPALPPGYRPQTTAEWTNFAAFAADRGLLLFNDVALGAGKKKAFKEGDEWRIVIPDKNNQMVNFVCQGTQQFQGREVAVLALTTTRTTQNGVGPVSGTAFYDLQNRVLVKLHVVGDNDTVMGVRNQTLDFVLQ
jgi:hypothetical protein